MPLGTESRTEEFMRLGLHRPPNQNGKRIRKRGRQAGLHPATVEATAFLGDLCRDGYGMKMERQEKYREKQQQPNDAATSIRARFRARDSHDSFLTQVAMACQSLSL